MCKPIKKAGCWKAAKVLCYGHMQFHPTHRKCNESFCRQTATLLTHFFIIIPSITNKNFKTFYQTKISKLFFIFSFSLSLSAFFFFSPLFSLAWVIFWPQLKKLYNYYYRYLYPFTFLFPFQYKNIIFFVFSLLLGS